MGCRRGRQLDHAPRASGYFSSTSSCAETGAPWPAALAAEIVDVPSAYQSALAVRALRDMPGGTLAIQASTTVLSDGTYVLATVPAPRHVAACWLDGAKWEQEFTLPLDVAEARMDFTIR